MTDDLAIRMKCLVSAIGSNRVEGYPCLGLISGHDGLIDQYVPALSQTLGLDQSFVERSQTYASDLFTQAELDDLDRMALDMIGSQDKDLHRNFVAQLSASFHKMETTETILYYDFSIPTEENPPWVSYTRRSMRAVQITKQVAQAYGIDHRYSYGGLYATLVGNVLMLGDKEPDKIHFDRQYPKNDGYVEYYVIEVNSRTGDTLRNVYFWIPVGEYQRQATSGQGLYLRDADNEFQSVFRSKEDYDRFVRDLRSVLQ